MVEVVKMLGLRAKITPDLLCSLVCPVLKRQRVWITPWEIRMVKSYGLVEGIIRSSSV
jgi:hypothetical protein